MSRVHGSVFLALLLSCVLFSGVAHANKALFWIGTYANDQSSFTGILQQSVDDALNLLLNDMLWNKKDITILCATGETLCQD